jgi:hypothetical protein
MPRLKTRRPRSQGLRNRLRSRKKKSRWTSRSTTDTFIEEQEDEDADVTDIIGGDVENKEEA